MNKQLVLEIYADCPLEKLILWLNSIIGPVKKIQALANSIQYSSAVGTLTIIPSDEEDPFLSISFDNSNSPWLTDVDFARQTASQLRCRVRCDPGQYYPEVDPLSDTFLEILNGQERLIVLE